MDGTRLLYILLAFVGGLFYVLNRMTNVRAVQTLGQVNGTMVNYIESTFISLALIFITGNGKDLTAETLTAIPFWMYFVSVLGLAAMIMQIIGSMHTNAVVASSLLMVGNFSMAVVLDCIIYNTFSIMKTAGIVLVFVGATWINSKKNHENEKA